MTEPIQNNPPSEWQAVREFDLTAENLQMLFDGQIPAIRVPGFASEEECDKFTEVLLQADFVNYDNFDPPMPKVGITQFESYLRGDNLPEGKDDYFGLAIGAEDTRAKLCDAAGFDPLKRIQQRITADLGVKAENAHEPDWGDYFAGLIRNVNKQALLHADHASLDGPGWEIDQIDRQLAWNLFLCAPESGGNCNVYNKHWSPDMNQYKMEGTYGTSHDAVEGCQMISLPPAKGDLVWFNSQCFHEVEAAEGNRFAMSSFVGRLCPEHIIFWS